MAVNACAPDSQSFARLSIHCRVNSARLSKMIDGNPETGRYIFRPARLEQGHYLESRPELVMTEHRASAL